MPVLYVNGKRFNRLITQHQIHEAIARMAEQMQQASGEEPIHLICVLKGAVPFATELLSNMPVDTRMYYVSASSYEGFHSTGDVGLHGLQFVPKNIRRAVIVEDIVESGNTVAKLKSVLAQSHQITSIQVATLLFKPDQLIHQTAHPDFVGFRIGKEFVIGYGLDYNEQGRGLRDIYLHEE